MFGCLLLIVSLITGCIASPAAEVAETVFDSKPVDFMTFKDSTNTLFLNAEFGDVYLSQDNGQSWRNGVISGQVCPIKKLIKHSFENSRVFALTECDTVYYSYDNGENWDYFTIDHPISITQLPFHFHAKNPDYVIFNNQYCSSSGTWVGKICKPDLYYTKDGFQSDPEPMPVGSSYCIFADSSEKMVVSSEEQIICISLNPNSAARPPFSHHIVYSDDWFQSIVPVQLHNFLGSDGAYGILSTGSFLVAALIDAATRKLFVYVSQDGYYWEEALKFHKGFEFDAFTILPSTEYSFFIDSLDSHPNNPTGILYSLDSESNTFVIRQMNTNRYVDGYTDFMLIDYLDGLQFVNVVENVDEIEVDPQVDKVLSSRITFDGGKTWSTVASPESSCNSMKQCSLHLFLDPHVSHASIASSKFAPGILLASGSVGDRLLSENQMDLFVSEDGGRNWTLSRDGMHLFAMSGFGSIFFASEYLDVINEVYYSLDHGQSWVTVTLDKTIVPIKLFASEDPYAEIFYLLAMTDDGEQSNYSLFSFNFGKFLPKECQFSNSESNKNDFEKWYTRYANGSPICSEMGKKEFFWRKKATSVCSVPKSITDLHGSFDACECTDEDYECNTQFISNDQGECKLLDFIGSLLCASEDLDTFQKIPYRLVPGNKCTPNKRDSHREPQTFNCDSFNEPGTEITSFLYDFDEKIVDVVYLEGTVPEENTFLIGISVNSHVYFSEDEGKTWDKFSKEEFSSVLPHAYNKNSVYMVTSKNIVYFTTNRGKNFYKFKAPSPPNQNGKSLFSFHPSRPAWLLYAGSENCEKNPFADDCRDVVFVSLDFGDTWSRLPSNLEYCSWAKAEKLVVDDTLIFCIRQNTNDPFKKELISSIDFFEYEQDEILNDVVGFMIEDEYVIVAVQDEEGTSLSLDVSINGLNFASCSFPAYLNVHPKQAYTILDSQTHSLFIHVTTNTHLGSEWGDILKSNSNGTYFMTSLANVNRDSVGYVDFERLEGIQGIALANIVSNTKELTDGGTKKLQTLITFNDGLDWSYLNLVGGEKIVPKCGKNCYLHLHGYTERNQFSDPTSTNAAVGLIIGVGSFSPFLIPYEESQTFISRDAGVTWYRIFDSPHLWAFLDSGSIIIAVESISPTNVIKYSADEGRTWQEYQFSEKSKVVVDVSTKPSGVGHQVLLLTTDDENAPISSVLIDFDALYRRTCVFDEENSEESDFVRWVPTDISGKPLCLRGRISSFYRKSIHKKCRVGSSLLVKEEVLSKCECTRADFECDYNYRRLKDGTCVLVSGLQPPDTREEQCSVDDAFEWRQPTGYKRTPLTECEGGVPLDAGTLHPCPGKEDDYYKAHPKPGGWSIFLTIIFSILLAAVAGCILYYYSRRFLKGAIRLGSDSATENPLESGISYTRGAFSSIPIFFSALYQSVRSLFIRSTPTNGEFENAAFLQNYEIDDDDEESV
ncbi:Sorting receptor for vacuolar protein [Schizosaccharomyces pombe]